eukprot:symbB.v1.2.033060.t1/scaffold3994.1/size46765/1
MTTLVDAGMHFEHHFAINCSLRPKIAARAGRRRRRAETTIRERPSRERPSAQSEGSAISGLTHDTHNTKGSRATQITGGSGVSGGTDLTYASAVTHGTLDISWWLPQGTRLPSFLILFTCFASHCSYMIVCSVYALYYREERGWSQAMYAGICQSSGEVFAAGAMRIMSSVNSLINQEEEPSWCITRLYRKAIEKPYDLAWLIFFWACLNACFMLPWVPVAVTAHVLMATVYAFSSKMAMELCLVYAMGDSEVFSNASFAPTTTVKQFKEAECRLKYFLQGAIPGHGVFPVPIVFDDQQIALDDATRIVEISSFAVGGKRKRIDHTDALPCPCEDWVEEAKQDSPEVSPTIQFVVSEAVIPALDGLRNRAFLEISCPRIHTCEEWNSLACTTLPAEERIELLQRQGDVWADDEIRMHLNHLAEQSPKEQNVVVWDPVLVTSVVMFGHFGIIDELASKLPPAATVVTAVIIEKHWYPLLWRVEVAQAWAFTCGHAWGFSVAINRLHQRVFQALKCQLTAVRFHSLAFRVESCCGAMAIQYLHHLIWGHDLPVSLPQLQERNRLFRTVLLGLLSSIDRPQRPWIWGLGEGTWFQTLKDVLIEHGVKQEDAHERAQLVVDKLGEKAVVGALKSQSAWKELKWYASQCVPMFQIIRPSELPSCCRFKGAEWKTNWNKGTKEAS